MVRVRTGARFNVETDGYAHVAGSGPNHIIEGIGVLLRAGFRTYVRIGRGVEASLPSCGIVLLEAGIQPGSLRGLEDGKFEIFFGYGLQVDVRLVVGEVHTVADGRVTLRGGRRGGVVKPSNRVDLRAGLPHKWVYLKVQVGRGAAIGVRVGVDAGDALAGAHPLTFRDFGDDAAVDGGATACRGGVVDHDPACGRGSAESLRGAGVGYKPGLSCENWLVAGATVSTEIHARVARSEFAGDVAIV